MIFDTENLLSVSAVCHEGHLPAIWLRNPNVQGVVHCDARLEQTRYPSVFQTLPQDTSEPGPDRTASSYSTTVCIHNTVLELMEENSRFLYSHYFPKGRVVLYLSSCIRFAGGC